MIGVGPFRGELGIAIRYHVPAVAALPRPVVVCIEDGMESLYPNAEHIIVPRRPDAQRKDRYRKDAAFVMQWTAELRQRYPGCTIVAPERSENWPTHRFVPEPHEPQGANADVVICPRKRTVAPERNWQGWPALADALSAAGLRVFAAGAAETSDTRVAADDAAWGYTRPLDATIEAMLSARLVVATDAGLAHLAVLCGRPLLIVGHGKLPAPGARWNVRMQEYYEAANFLNAPIALEGRGWNDAAVVARRALRILDGAGHVARTGAASSTLDGLTVALPRTAP